MTVTKVADHLRMVSRSGVNAYVLEAADGVTLVDTGYPGTQDEVAKAVGEFGRPMSDVRHIVLTHAHPDHIGSAAALASMTGTLVLIHALDRSIAERGAGFRPMTAAPGLLSAVLFRLFVKADAVVDPVPVAGTIADGEVLPAAGGLEAIHVPGHCAGQVALLWRPHATLFAADAGTNLFGLGDPVGFEDLAEGRRSQVRLGRFDFETACFGHGKPIIGDAAAKIRRKWAESNRQAGPRDRR